ncbi:MAG: TIM barrel protein, partial [Synergistaceae bacterium]|nr:TIM barrel protein [Synergistaceae bacterium]
MKLSFSTCGWSSKNWTELCQLAAETGFDGIEIHEQWQPLYSGSNLLEPAVTNAAYRDLLEKKLTIPCLDLHCDIADASKKKETLKTVSDALTAAKKLHVPNLRLAAYSCGENTDSAVSEIIAELLPEAKQTGVTLLVETIGVYADTVRLCALLDSFADDRLGAVWDINHTCRDAGESPADTVKRLGAYIKHVHLKDSSAAENGDIIYNLIGEGTLPIEDVMRSLYSINYDGFISLEWKPFWDETELELELVALHFINHIKKYGDTARQTKKLRLYENKTGTGKFPWQKDKLIDCTFGRVLDKMVEEFPDQYAFKYTTLDYTRTYSEFREDVDEFARVLVSLGVKPGSHVAVWATNLPQWYITFWAAVKIGAVLVSVNTAYKIAEAEYLFRQS